MTAVRRRLFVVVMMLGACAPAAAHVTIAPKTATAGTVATLTFRCPSELPAAATTQLIVQMPVNAPFAHVDVVPLRGWRVTITQRTLAHPIATAHGALRSVVDTIAWSGTIRAGTSQAFTIHAGPLAAGTLAFKVLQRYSNGTIVRWIELRNPGEPEPAYPAPVVHVTSR